MSLHRKGRPLPHPWEPVPLSYRKKAANLGWSHAFLLQHFSYPKKDFSGGAAAGSQVLSCDSAETCTPLGLGISPGFGCPGRRV